MLSPAVVSPYVLAGEGSCNDERMIMEPTVGFLVDDTVKFPASAMGFLGVAGDCDMVSCTQQAYSYRVLEIQIEFEALLLI